MTGPWSGSARWWFAALDRRSVTLDEREWVVHVVGVHVRSLDVWIQLELAGVELRSLVLHVTRGMNVSDALAAIKTTLAAEPA